VAAVAATVGGTSRQVWAPEPGVEARVRLGHIRKIPNDRS